ncbi:MAG: Serine/threonine protein phosphatase [Oscillospiraceae bacterium]|nr:Serine/threonine protein phosphatase [Oscillospiraceae bacterium]
MENAVLKQIILPAGRRVIAVSDIHGNLDYLTALLRKVQFSTADILILIGDILERGPRNLDTIRYLMELCTTHTVYPLQGNWDVDALFSSLPDELVFRILQNRKGRVTFSDMQAELGFGLTCPEEIPQLRRAARERFAAELHFMGNLPTILETQRHIFVHGGIPRETELDQLDRWSCMKNDHFFSQGYSFRKWVVVGHWPTSLYRDDIACCDPLVAEDRHVIAIDGGCVLKEDGQLNALILPDGNREDFTWTRYDHFPVAVALTSQEASVQWTVIKFSDNLVEILERQGEFTLCRHKSSGSVLPILTSHLMTPDDDESQCIDSTDYRLPVSPGDRLSIITKTRHGYLAKKEGITGWYQGELAWQAQEQSI